jgi:putative flippase GtrA
MNFKFIKYLIFGGVGVLVDYSIFYILVDYSLHYQFANASGYLFGTIVSFLFNRKLTFNVIDRVAYRFMLFVGVAAIGYLLSATILFFLVDFFSMDAKFVKLITLPIVAIFQFILNKNVTFIIK